MSGKRWIAVLALALSALLAAPAAAQAASIDLGVTQNVSTKSVKPGGTVNIGVTVTNLGTQNYDQSYVELVSFGGHGKGADAPYLSFSTSQGSCSDNSSVAYGYTYHYVDCSLGSLAPGQSVQITAAVQVNQNMNHCATLLSYTGEGPLNDDNNSNNEQCANVFLDVPPTVSGSKRIKLIGLPKSCVNGDFTLTAKAKAAKVKKMKINADFGFDENGNGQFFSKSANGKRLTAKVPASKAAVTLDKTYTIHVKAKLGGGHALKAIITYTRC